MTTNELIRQLIASPDQEVANVFAIAQALKLNPGQIETMTEDLQIFKQSTIGPRDFMPRLHAYLASKHYNDTEAVLFGWVLCKYIGSNELAPFGEKARELFTKK